MVNELNRTRDENTFRGFAFVFQAQAGMEREKCFGDLPVGIVHHDLRFFGLIQAFDLRNNSDQREPDDPFDIK